MKTGLIMLLIAVVVTALLSLVSCDETPSTTESDSSSPVIRVTENVGVTDSSQARPPAVIEVAETVSVSDSPRALPPNVIGLTEAVRVTDIPRLFTSAVIRINETIYVTDSPTLTPAQGQQQHPPAEVAVWVTSPKAGEIWHTGTAQKVMWKTSGEGIAWVDIYYSTDGGKSMISVARQEPDDGIYTWKVPNTPSKTVLIRVLAFNLKKETLALGDSGLFVISIQ
jgi:hypothetical protein